MTNEGLSYNSAQHSRRHGVTYISSITLRERKKKSHTYKKKNTFHNKLAESYPVNKLIFFGKKQKNNLSYFPASPHYSAHSVYGINKAAQTFAVCLMNIK